MISVTNAHFAADEKIATTCTKPYLCGNLQAINAAHQVSNKGITSDTHIVKTTREKMGDCTFSHERRHRLIHKLDCGIVGHFVLLHIVKCGSS